MHVVNEKRLYLTVRDKSGVGAYVWIALLDDELLSELMGGDGWWSYMEHVVDFLSSRMTLIEGLPLDNASWEVVTVEVPVSDEADVEKEYKECI